MIDYYYTTFIITRIQINKNMSYLSSSDLYELLWYFTGVCKNLRIRLIDWLEFYSVSAKFQPYNCGQNVRYDITYDHLMKLSNLKISGDLIMGCLQFGYIYMNRTGHGTFLAHKETYIHWISFIYNRGYIQRVLQRKNKYFSVRPSILYRRYSMYMMIFVHEGDMIFFYKCEL